MIGPSGSPLERRFYCPRDGTKVDADEIVKGYELDDGSYIVVTDQELLRPRAAKVPRDRPASVCGAQ